LREAGADTSGVSASNYLENKLLDHCLDVAAYTAPTAVYVKLHIGDPGEAGTDNAAGETDRMAATFGSASSGSATTSADITWTSVSTSETYSHVSIWDSDTAGNCLFVGALTASKAVVAGDNFKISAGSLTVTCD
jgi:hypothetical protein